MSYARALDISKFWISQVYIKFRIWLNNSWICLNIPNYDCMLFIIWRTCLRVKQHYTVCLNVKELLARSRRHIWSLNDSNEIWTNNLLICKRTLNRLVKMTIWLSCVVSTYLYGAFECMLLLCNVRSQTESTLYSFSECQGNPCLNQELYLNFKCQQQNLNAQPLSS